jgi:hypothetical protein
LPPTILQKKSKKEKKKKGEKRGQVFGAAGQGRVNQAGGNPAPEGWSATG